MIHTSKMQILRTSTVNNSIELNVEKEKMVSKVGQSFKYHMKKKKKTFSKSNVEKKNKKNVLLVCETNPFCIL